MGDENKNLEELAKKLGIDDRNIITKASEHLRLLKVKSNSLNINEYPKNVICLDIAASNANATIEFDKALAVLKYGRAKYRKDKNTIQSILNVSRVPDVKYICSSLMVNRSKELEKNSIRILSNYKSSNAKELAELSHPQYDAMAVYQTSKLLKIKVNENKLIDFSHLKRMQWTNLKIRWQRWSDENKVKLNTKRKAEDVDLDQADASDDIKKDVKENIKIEDNTETYISWKKRILDKAYADLKKMEN